MSRYILQTEDDLVIMISALLDVLTLMPIVPSYISPYLHDLFEVFRYVANGARTLEPSRLSGISYSSRI